MAGGGYCEFMAAVSKVRVWVAAVVILSLTLLPVPADAHTQCAHNTSAIGSSPAVWNNNWWIGYNTSGTIQCLYNSNFTTGVQRINWAQGFRQSGIDGQYGALTHQDVRSFQSLYGLGVDGLVGHQTWLKYASRITYYSSYLGFESWKTTTGGNIWFGHRTSTGQWYVLNLAGSNWATFDTSGPS